MEFQGSDNNKEVLTIFQNESEEIIERIFNNLFTLEDMPANKELIASVYRDLHSLKGAVRMVGFNNIQTILHKMEDIFDAVNNEKYYLEPNVIKLLSHSLEAVSGYLQDSVKNEREILGDKSHFGKEQAVQSFGYSVDCEKSHGGASEAAPWRKLVSGRRGGLSGAYHLSEG